MSQWVNGSINSRILRESSNVNSLKGEWVNESMGQSTAGYRIGCSILSTFYSLPTLYWLFTYNIERIT
jgi:hypothetical protein